MPVQPPTVTISYLPLLEGAAGKVFLTNNATTTLQYVVGGGEAPVPNQAIQSGVIAFHAATDSLYQGRLNIQYDVVSGKHELAYSGSNWTAEAPDKFYVRVDLKDIAFHKSGKYDLYPVAPATPASERSGGSDFRFYVYALAQPVVGSITPSSIVADGSAKVVTINLKRRLHSSQNPTVSIVAASGSAPVSFSPLVPKRNASNQIVGWTTVVTANPQPSGSVTLLMTASETLTYLKDDNIATEVVQYMSATDIGGFGVTQSSNSAAYSVVTAQLEPGQGSDTYHGKLNGILISGGNQLPTQPTSYNVRDAMFAGVLDAKIEVVNGINTFGDIKIVAKPSGSTTRTELGTTLKTLNGLVPNPDGSGNQVYKATHTLQFRTSALPAGLPGSDLSSQGSWDIGYVCYSPSGSILLVNWFGSYVNGNLSLNYPAYTAYVVMGSSIYKWHPVSGWEGATPTLKGNISIYLSENWNAFNGMGGRVAAWDKLDYRIDSGAWVTVVDATHPEERQNFTEDYGVKVVNLDTTTLATGVHNLEWRLNADFMTRNGDTARSATIPLNINQGVAGGDGATFALQLLSSIDSTFFRTDINVAPATWDFSTIGQNGITGNVVFSVAGVPAGAFAGFTPPSGAFLSSGQGPSTVLSVIGGTAPLGNYALTVSATCGSIVKNSLVNLRIQSPGGGLDGCVPAGTMVETIFGQLPIEELRVGDIVVSYNDKTLSKSTAIIKALPTYENRQLFEITTNNGVLVCSHDHRLAVLSQTGPSYLPARGLAVGDVLFYYDNGVLTPTDVTAIIPLERYEKVYHLSLGHDHVFIAGGYAAHNMKPQPDNPDDPRLDQPYVI